MTEPTPRPWKATIGNSRAIIRAGSFTVASCGMGNEANARLIVTAVNCHDELVGALTECMDWMQAYGGNAGRLIARRQLAVIAKARAQSEPGE